MSTSKQQHCQLTAGPTVQELMSLKARDCSLAPKPTYMLQNFALISLIKLVMNFDMISSLRSPSCHGHMLLILHDIFPYTNNPLYVQNLAFVLASQASHCPLCLSLCLQKF